MDMVISISALGNVAAPALRLAVGSGSEASESALHLQFDHGRLAEDAAANQAPGHAANDDPVVQRFSRALTQLGDREDEAAAVYADALRLAIVTRMLSLRTQPQPELQPAPPAEQQTRSGLPKWRLKRVAAYVEENISEAITLAGMAAAAGLSRMHFAAQFRVATGMRPHEYVMRQRIERAKQMLLETRDSLVQVALGVGFQTQAHFTTVFRRFVGDTPYQWRCANSEFAQA
ncbi:helix-turn-helix transcriptional regulator [Starkeya sp. ORNL1]|nr:helix-turn-helix transcriptional regulator [Starkeya sp. ORNL1]